MMNAIERSTILSIPLGSIRSKVREARAGEPARRRPLNFIVKPRGSFSLFRTAVISISCVASCVTPASCGKSCYVVIVLEADTCAERDDVFSLPCIL